MGLLLLILLGLQLAVMGTGFYLLWRRLDRAGDEIRQLRTQLEGQAVGNLRRVRAGNVVITEPATPTSTPAARAAFAWNLSRRSVPLSGPTLTAETGRVLAMAVAAATPAVGFFAGSGIGVIAAGLMVATAIMLLSLRPLWRAGAWTATVAAGAWTLVGFALAAAQAQPGIYSLCVAITATAGLTHAHLRRAGPGIALTLAMTAAALALGSQIGMVSAVGVAFSAIVVAGAIIGSATLRLEPVHVVAFGAALLGLFVLSGQETAAIWFTPAAAWTGAAFLAIAAVRVPHLGSRGAVIAATGAFAPLSAVAALHFAGHGLADNLAAAAGFLGLAGLLSGIFALTVLRRARGVSALRFTRWVLVFGAFVALAGTVLIAMPAPLQALAFAAISVGLLALHQRLPDSVWRAFAVVAALASLLCAGSNAQLLLDEAAHWPASTVILAGLAAPAVLIGVGALLAHRSNAPASGALFEIITFVLGVAAANLFTRLAFSGGATLIQPVSFVEIAMHCVVWLIAALLIGSRAHLGARGVRDAATNLLTLASFATMAFACGLWLASFWGTRVSAPGEPLLNHDTMGFLLPAIFFWAHWVFWRARGAHAQTRLSLAAGAVLLAAFVTVEAVRAEHLPQWVGALAAALSFSLAIIVNFAPGVVSAAVPVRRRGKSPSRSAHPEAH